jgi:hypothetical protein
MANNFWDKEELLGTIQKGSEQIQVRATERKGKAYIDIRNYYMDEDGEYRPSPKGLAIPRILISDIRKYLPEK